MRTKVNLDSELINLLPIIQVHLDGLCPEEKARPITHDNTSEFFLFFLSFFFSPLVWFAAEFKMLLEENLQGQENGISTEAPISFYLLNMRATIIY